MSKKTDILIFVTAMSFTMTSCGDDINVTVPKTGTLQFYTEKQWESTGEKDILDKKEGGQGKEAPKETGKEADTSKQREGEPDSRGETQAEQDKPDKEGARKGRKDDPGMIRVTVSTAGDVTLGNYLGQNYEYSFLESWEKNQDAAYYFENVLDIFSQDDMTLVNLEGPLTRAEECREDKTYCIGGYPELASILTAGSVEAVGMANNHHLDYFEQGSRDTVEAVEAEGIVYAYDRNLGIYDTAKGIRIGIVSVNEVEQRAGVESVLKEGITRLKEEGVDLILATCHWGVERVNYPEDYQQSIGRKCIDWGADLVIGHHPHVIQGVERYNGKYIVYSLGNFCFGANRNPPDKDCIIFQQTFCFSEGVLLEDTQARVIPCSVSSVPTRNDYKPTPAEGSEAERILGRMNEYSEQFGVQFDDEGYVQ